MTATPVTSYAECREVLRSPAFVQTSKRESAEFVGGTVLTLDGRVHTQRRRLEAPLFAPVALRTYELSVLEPTIRRCLTELPAVGVAGPAQVADEGPRRTDLVLLGRTIFLQLAAATIGLDGVDTPAATSQLAAYLYPLLEGVTVEWSTRDHGVVIAEAAAARKGLFRDFFAASWARRRSQTAAGNGTARNPDTPLSLLDLLATHGIDEAAALREVVLFLAASTLNNAALVTNVVHELHGWADEHPHQRACLADPDVLQAAMVEALRLHVPTPALFRRATQDVVLRGGRAVAAGEEVALDLVAANRDPAVFGADADRFDPWRAAPAAAPVYGLTFGAGVHVCLGRPQVLGGYADDGGRDQTQGMLLRVLQALFAVGIAPDPDAEPTVEPSIHRRFGTYPVVLTGSDHGTGP